MIPSYPVSVKAVVENEGRFLMIKADRRGRTGFSFPGGLVDPGEPLEEALRREVREETGYLVDVGRPFHADKYEHPEGGENVVIFYSCRLAGGEPELGSEPDQRFLSLEWVKPGEAPGWANDVMGRALKSDYEREE